MRSDYSNEKPIPSDGSVRESTPKFERRNMQSGIAHGAFFRMATAFADPFAVVPLFFAGFTDSRALIGLVVSLMEAMVIVPQFAISRRLRHKPHEAKPIMLAGIWTRCGVWGLIAVITLAAPPESLWIPVLFTLLVAVYSLGAGAAVIPFKYVIAGTVSEGKRGSFFGWRMLLGGVLAVLAGIGVKEVLGYQALPWPRNYGILFLLSFVSLIVAYIAMSRFRFPEPTAESKPKAILSLTGEIRKALHEYPILKRLVSVRLLSGGLRLALPFLTLYATQEAGISLAWVGVLIVAQQVGAILSNLAWIPLGNRSGTKAVILSGLGLAVGALAILLLSRSAVAFLFAFVFAGGAMSATIVGYSGYILELGTLEIRPFLFALEGVLLMPLYFSPLLGGWIADLGGYQAVLITGATLLVTALLLAVTLCEPRNGGVRCGPASSRS